MKRGIYDFITKDFRMGELRKVVSKALETQKLLVENERLRQALKERSASGRMMGRSAAFLKIMQTVSQIAPMKSTVLLSVKAVWVKSSSPTPSITRAPDGPSPW